jgi:hypothetical protein
LQKLQLLGHTHGHELMIPRDFSRDIERYLQVMINIIEKKNIARKVSDVKGTSNENHNDS